MFYKKRRGASRRTEWGLWKSLPKETFIELVEFNQTITQKFWRLTKGLTTH